MFVFDLATAGAIFLIRLRVVKESRGAAGVTVSAGCRQLAWKVSEEAAAVLTFCSDVGRPSSCHF